MALFYLAHDVARWRAVEAVREAPQGYVVRVTPPNRTSDQNAKFHALCGDLARAGVPWAGKPRTLDEWKALLVSAHATATSGEAAEVVQGLEGEMVQLRESTALMSKSRSSSLIEYAQAFAAQVLETER